MYKLSLSLLIALLIQPQPSRADLVIEVQDASEVAYAPGGTGTLSVWAQQNEGFDIYFDNWTLAFKLSDPTVWSSYSLTESALLGGLSNFASPPDSSSDYDVLARTTGFPTPALLEPTLLAGPVRIKLFNINFTVAEDAVVGDYSLSFIPAAKSSLDDYVNSVTYTDQDEVIGFYEFESGNLLASDGVSGFEGKFQVQSQAAAVPEPSSILMVGAGAFAVGAWRRMRGSGYVRVVST